MKEKRLQKGPDVLLDVNHHDEVQRRRLAAAG
jgi:hypothetical protein